MGKNKKKIFFRIKYGKMVIYYYFGIEWEKK